MEENTKSYILALFSTWSISVGYIVEGSKFSDQLKQKVLSPGELSTLPGICLENIS